MPVHPNVKVCTHIKVTGVRCGSPSLRGEQFCYFHERLIRGVATPPRPRIKPMALLEDEESIQVALMEIVNDLLCGTIELKRAELILRALNTAVRNIRRVNFRLHANMVTEVPEYAAPQYSEPAAPPMSVHAYPPIRVATDAPVRPVPVQSVRVSAAASPAPVGTSAPASPVQVGTAAPGCPSGPVVPARIAAPPPQPPAPLNPAPRKPQVSVRETVAPKERKNTAHGASRG